VIHVHPRCSVAWHHAGSRLSPLKRCDPRRPERRKRSIQPPFVMTADYVGHSYSPTSWSICRATPFSRTLASLRSRRISHRSTPQLLTAEVPSVGLPRSSSRRSLAQANKATPSSPTSMRFRWSLSRSVIPNHVGLNAHAHASLLVVHGESALP